MMHETSWILFRQLVLSRTVASFCRAENGKTYRCLEVRLELPRRLLPSHCCRHGCHLCNGSDSCIAQLYTTASGIGAPTSRTSEKTQKYPLHFRCLSGWRQCFSAMRNDWVTHFTSRVSLALGATGIALADTEDATEQKKIVGH